jgi:acetylornithine deacetylase
MEAGRFATDTELRVVAEIAAHRDELVGLVSDLVAFDTVGPQANEHRSVGQEAELQQHLAARLRAAGLEVEVWEPDPRDVEGMSFVPPGLRFEGRPQLLARYGGTGGGRSLLFNGHIDVVPAGGGWNSPPFEAQVRDGRLYGRGACDMKGGVAAMVFAVETLARLGVRLAGELLINTVTDEETSGAGSVASVAHGVRADGCLIPEPTSLNLWTACPGSLMATVTVPGRAGHAALGRPADLEPRDAQQAVNAIDKAAIVLAALRDLREEWQVRYASSHPLLRPGDILPTAIRAGEWAATHPGECTFTLLASYLPAQADAGGWGTEVRTEIERRIATAAKSDLWLKEHAPTVTWADSEVPAYEADAEDPLVGATREAAVAVGAPGELARRTTGFDAPSFARAGIPTIGFGPGSIALAHAPDEYVPVTELVECAQALALIALRFSG